MSVYIETVLKFFEIFVFAVRWLIAHFSKRTSDSVACLIGKTAIVTGGNSGIGLATVKLLASRGCQVIIADRNISEEAIKTVVEQTGNANIFIRHLDLSSLNSIREFVKDLKKSYKKIDILINNAGIGASEEKCTKDGLNTVMQINYFGAFLLTHLLMDQLKAAKSARVVFTASCLAILHNLDVKTLNITEYERNMSNIMSFYANSKLCNILAAQSFGKKLEKYGILVNSIEPGTSRTPIYNYYGNEVPGSWLTKLGLEILLLFGTDEFIAAQSTFHVSTSEKLTKTGQHFFRCENLMKPKICYDENLAEQIWEYSENLVKLKPEEKII